MARRLMDDVSFGAEHVPSVSTINRIIRLTCTIDRHADRHASQHSVRYVSNHYLLHTLAVNFLLHFARVVDDAKCIVVTRVCVSVCGRTPTLLHGPGCNFG